MKAFWISMLLGLFVALPAAAEPSRYREETRRVLERSLDPDMYAQIKDLLDPRLDPRGELNLSSREEADLKELLRDVPGEFRRRYPHGLQDWILPPRPPEPPAQPTAPAPTNPQIPKSQAGQAGPAPATPGP